VRQHDHRPTLYFRRRVTASVLLGLVIATLFVLLVAREEHARIEREGYEARASNMRASIMQRIDSLHERQSTIVSRIDHLTELVRQCGGAPVHRSPDDH